MQRWALMCWALLALVGADECPDGGRCEVGQTCCKDPASGYDCCPFQQAECCQDHMHCCPASTICDMITSSCVNATVSIPWVPRSPSAQPRLSKSFRMIKTYKGEDDDNVCPDQSQCPPEFSCLRSLAKFGCCPLAQGISCSDGKHCCPKGHQCSADSRSCIEKELVSPVLCSDGVSECPDGTSCCETPEGKWGCCPLPKAVCCEDKLHCCPEGSTCDVRHSKCISLTTKTEMPMWAKLPARTRAAWESQKEAERAVSGAAGDARSKKAPEVTPVNALPLSEKEIPFLAAGKVPCNETAACPDNTTCCKTASKGWSCCPLPKAVCCEDFVHCCPEGTTCNLPAQTCDEDSRSVPWHKKIPTIPRQGARVGVVQCDPIYSCLDGSTCCKNKQGQWACCPLPEAVCCDDHEHCCPNGTTCDPNSIKCLGPAGATAMKQKVAAFAASAHTTAAAPPRSPVTSTKHSGKQGEEVMKATEEHAKRERRDRVQCDAHTSCPHDTTCCFMGSEQKWGCCPLPEAVCCTDGNHCCPSHYKCDEHQTSCIKEGVAIPWYTKLPATSSRQADSRSVHCDAKNQCPELTTCCQLSSGEWGCCPLQNAMCCPDKEHCCPQGYTCNVVSQSCQRLVMLQLETVPLTAVQLSNKPQPQFNPLKHRKVKCDETTSCQDGQTCCRISSTEWGCCPFANAVCCSDMLHCCPSGYTCTQAGDCIRTTGRRWSDWRMLTNKIEI